MSFGAPFWLVAALLVAVLGAFGLRADAARRRRDLGRFAAAELLPGLVAGVSDARRRARGALVLAALVLGLVALARPTWGHREEELHARGTDVVFALDVSRSMLARDVRPDRLTRAKMAVTDLVRKLPEDRVGLVAFAGSAFLQAPLTLDHGAFQEALDALDTRVIPRGGSDLGAALHVAEDAFASERTGERLVVLVTDGEDLAGNGRNAAAEAAKRGVRLYTVGVGTPEGDLLPLEGGRGFVQDARGQRVTSRLDEASLRDMAETTGGFYVPLGQRGEGLEALYARALAPAERGELASLGRRVPIERFQWPLAAALVLLVVEALLSERRRARAPARRGVAAPATAAALALLAVLPASASPRDAAAAYERGEYAAAHDAFAAAAAESPDDARLHFNEGVAAYRAGRFDAAAGAFRRAIGSGDVPLQQRGYYDLGNAEFRRAEGSASPQDARAALEEAIRAYDGALALDPEDEDARFNRSVAEERLRALAEPPPQSQPSEGESDDAQEPSQGSPQESSEGAESGSQGEGESSPESGASGSSQPPGQSAASQSPEGSDGSTGSQPSADGDSGQAPHEAAPETGEGGGPDEAARDRGEERSEGGDTETDQEAGQEPAADSGAGGARADASRSGAEPETAGEPEGAEAEPGTMHAQHGAVPERADGAAGGAAAPATSASGDGAEGMTAADAAHLLDSLRDEEAKLLQSGAGRGARSQLDGPIQDW